MTIAAADRLIVEDLILFSAMTVDRLDFDGWLDCFLPEAKYVVLPRENRDAGYPAAVITCANRAIMQDRITVLHRASKYNPHQDRHILGRTEFRSSEAGVFRTWTNFTIVQSTLEGFSKLFCAGVYEDVVQLSDGVAKFQERVAVIDTFSVPNLIATPI